MSQGGHRLQRDTELDVNRRSRKSAMSAARLTPSSRKRWMSISGTVPSALISVASGRWVLRRAPRAGVEQAQAAPLAGVFEGCRLRDETTEPMAEQVGRFGEQATATAAASAAEPDERVVVTVCTGGVQLATLVIGGRVESHRGQQRQHRREFLLAASPTGDQQDVASGSGTRMTWAAKAAIGLDRGRFDTPSEGRATAACSSPRWPPEPRRRRRVPGQQVNAL